MCGIAGIYFKNPDVTYLTHKELEDTVDWLLCGIEHRGKDATGIALQMPDGTQRLEKSDMPASKFIFWRQDLPENPRTILMHTRLATKGKPENLLNNHPVQYENIMAIHNGHISNDDELFKEEEINRIAEVDSEIIPALFNKYGTADPKTALEKLGGGFAIAVMDELNPGSLILAKGSSSPLHYIETSAFWMWASVPDVITRSLVEGMNFEAKIADIQELKYGEYIMINGLESDKQEFKPYVKSYTPTGSTTYVGSTTPRSNSGVRSTYDGWHKGNNGLYGRDQCDECFVWYATNKLERIGHEWYCEHCIEKMFEDMDGNGYRKPKGEKKKLSRKERKRLRKQKARGFQEKKSGETKTIVIPKNPETIADALDNEHWAVCQLVAEHYGTKADFVNFLLFSDADIEDFEDPNLVSLYIDLEEKYQQLLEEVRGETDGLIEELAKKDSASASCEIIDVKNPVGF